MSIYQFCPKGYKEYLAAVQNELTALNRRSSILFKGQISAQNHRYGAHHLLNYKSDSDRSFSLTRLRGFRVPGGNGNADASNHHTDPGHWRHVLIQQQPAKKSGQWRH